MPSPPRARRDRGDQAPVAVGRRPAPRRRPRSHRARVRTRRRGGDLGPRRRALRRHVGRPPRRTRRDHRTAARKGLLLDARASRDRTGRRRRRRAPSPARPRRRARAELISVAGSLGLDTLVEAHDAAELERGVALDAPVLGVNARDLADVHDRSSRPARARGPHSRRSHRDRRERHRDARAGRRRRARRSGRRSRRLDADARRRPGSEARASCSLGRSSRCAGSRAKRTSPWQRRRAPISRASCSSPRARAPRPASCRCRRGCSRVAVWVGEAGESDADLDQVHTIEDGKVRGREATLLRNGVEVARLLDLPWEGSDPGHWQSASREPKGASCSREGSGPGTCGLRSPRCRPWAVDAASSLEVAPGIKDHCQGEAIRGGSAHMTTDRDLRPLRRPLRARDAHPCARRAGGRLDRGTRRRRLSRRGGAPRPNVHRSSLADHARAAVRAGQEALPQARGPQPHGRPQDQQRARAGRARAAARQDAASSPRREPGSTASRPRPPARASGSNASSSWAPRTCVARRRTSSGCT